MKYPTRCEIVDVGEDVHVGPYQCRTPDKSKPHIGKQGLAERDGVNVKITLDDGNILWGSECWWNPIPKKPEDVEDFGPLCDFDINSIED